MLPCLQASWITSQISLLHPNPHLRFCFWMNSNWDITLSSKPWPQASGPCLLLSLHPCYPLSPTKSHHTSHYSESNLFQIPASHRLFALLPPAWMLLSCVHPLGSQSNVTSSWRFPGPPDYECFSWPSCTFLSWHLQMKWVNYLMGGRLSVSLWVSQRTWTH